jgi:ethanolamine utilization microcompartment shell protein EutS
LEIKKFRKIMTDHGTTQAQAEGESGTLAEFLANLGKSLCEKEGVDIGLADILAKHLLTIAPTVDAVAKAKDAILKLASDRANPPKPELVDG